MGPEHVLALRTLVDVALSPDGRIAACEVHEIDSARASEHSYLLLVDLETTQTERIADDNWRDARPRWAPAGHRLAFLSDRAAARVEPGAANVFVIDLDRSREFRQITRAEGGVTDYAWCPRGERLCVVVSDTYQSDVRLSDARVYETAEFWDPPFGWQDARRAHLWITDLTGAMRQLTNGDADDREPSWSPDGAFVAFASNRASGREWRRGAQIWVVATDGESEPRQISIGSGDHQRPTFSPSGGELAYFAPTGEAPDPHRHDHLWVADIDGARPPRDIVSTWDRPVGNYVLSEARPHAGHPAPRWSPEGEQLLFVATDRGAVRLYSVPRGGGVPEPITEPERELIAFDCDRAGKKLVAIITSPTSPPELYAGRTGHCLSPVTGLNRDILDQVDLAQIERFECRSKDGHRLDGWLVKPPAFDPENRYPLIHRIQGGPGLAYGDTFSEDVQVLAGRGFLVSFINPRGTQSYGRDFARALAGEWLRGDYEDHMAALDYLLERSYVDADRLGVMGASYGGLMVNHIVTVTNRFAAAVSQRSISNLLSLMGVGPYITSFVVPDIGGNPYLEPHRYVELSPIARVGHVTTPILLLQAGNDFITPVGQALEFFVGLRYFGKEARLVVYPTEEHYVRRYGSPSAREHYLGTIVDWFVEHLGYEQAARTVEASPAAPVA